MNSIAAANLFENPLVLVAIVLLGALSNWLMKRRGQKDAAASPTPKRAANDARRARALDRPTHFTGRLASTAERRTATAGTITATHSSRLP